MYTAMYSIKYRTAVLLFIRGIDGTNYYLWVTVLIVPLNDEIGFIRVGQSVKSEPFSGFHLQYKAAWTVTT